MKVVGEVLTCCWRYGRPMDKGIFQGGPLDQQLDKGRPSSSEKKRYLVFCSGEKSLPFFFAENLTISEFDPLEADFFLLPFEPLGGLFCGCLSSLAPLFFYHPPPSFVEGSALPFLKPTKDQVSFLALFVFSRHHLPPKRTIEVKMTTPTPSRLLGYGAHKMGIGYDRYEWRL